MVVSIQSSVLTICWGRGSNLHGIELSELSLSRLTVLDDVLKFVATACSNRLRSKVMQGGAVVSQPR